MREKSRKTCSSSAGGSAVPRVERQLVDTLPLHRVAELALDHRADQQGEEVDEEESLDPAFVLEEDGAMCRTSLSCSKRFSIVGWRLWAARTSAGVSERSFVSSGYMPSLFWS